MTAAEFLADKSLPLEWKKELENNTLLKMVMEICENESPINQSPALASDTSASFSYGRAYGWQERGNFMRYLGEPKRKVPTSIPRTYGAAQE